MKFIISAILSLCINNVYAQKITGVITDRDNNPIEFATISFMNAIPLTIFPPYKPRFNLLRTTSDVRNVSKKM